MKALTVHGWASHILGLCCGYLGIMEKNMETAIVKGLGLYWDYGKENGNYYNGVIQGLGFRVGIPTAGVPSYALHLPTKTRHS